MAQFKKVVYCHTYVIKNGLNRRSRRELRHDGSRQRQVRHPVPIRRRLTGRLQISVPPIESNEVSLR